MPGFYKKFLYYNKMMVKQKEIENYKLEQQELKQKEIKKEQKRIKERTAYMLQKQ